MSGKKKINKLLITFKNFDVKVRESIISDKKKFERGCIQKTECKAGTNKDANGKDVEFVTCCETDLCNANTGYKLNSSCIPQKNNSNKSYNIAKIHLLLASVAFTLIK